jgi:hypothetical protein
MFILVFIGALSIACPVHRGKLRTFLRTARELWPRDALRPLPSRWATLIRSFDTAYVTTPERTADSTQKPASASLRSSASSGHRTPSEHAWMPKQHGGQQPSQQGIAPALAKARS